MAVVSLTRTTWVQINSAAQRVQTFGGRVAIASSATPAANDYFVWPAGVIADVTEIKYAQALDPAPTYVVVGGA